MWHIILVVHIHSLDIIVVLLSENALSCSHFFVFYASFHRGSKRKKNIQKKKGHFERSSCFRPFPETTFLERRRRRGAVLSSKKKKEGRKKRRRNAILVDFEERNAASVDVWVIFGSFSKKERVFSSRTAASVQLAT